MGQTTSSIAKKVSDWTRSKEENPSPPDTSSLSLSKAQVNPFVYRRISRKFVDADGDIAHEFYVQQTITYKTPNSRKRKSKVIMKKVSEEDLTPVGMEELSHPAINPEFPIVICDARVMD